MLAGWDASLKSYLVALVSVTAAFVFFDNWIFENPFSAGVFE